MSGLGSYTTDLPAGSDSFGFADSSCSFAGGCLLSSTDSALLQAGLASSIEVTLCDSICNIDITSTSEFQCILSPIATTYSVQTYQVLEPTVLEATWTGDSNSDSLHNGDEFDLYSTSNADCWF